MYLIGERINGMFEDIKKAVQEKDEGVIKHWVEEQIKEGADALDVNAGPSSDKPLEAMEWLIGTVRKHTDITLAVDTTKLNVMERGLELAGEGKGIINSANGEPNKLAKLLDLAKKYKAKVIGLTMNEKGIPVDASQRVEIAAQIITSATEAGISPDDLFIDAVILPVNVAQGHPPQVLETISQVKMLCDPPCRAVLGLSNVSQKCNNRPLINKVYLVMAIARGLDAAIVDVCDRDLVDSAICAELLLNKQIYCDNYCEAYRKK
ncbi:MAG: dihydropteroate synthase [bacterium]